MGLDLEIHEGQTAIYPDEKKDLRIKTITNRKELDEFEQLNIEKAILFTLGRKFSKEEILSEKFICNLHKKMFGDVWKWAGKFRTTNKNIGVDKFQISTKLKNLLEDCKYWINKSTFSEEEICIRFKHKLVSIHVFVNGNGRHSRLMADLMIEKIFSKPLFTWGSKNKMIENTFRQNYLNALKEADLGNYKSLIEYASM